jgi:periplasmic protein TonB
MVPRKDNSLLLIAAMLGLSFAAHAITIYRLPTEAAVREAKRTVEMEFFEPPKPPEPPKEKPPEPEPPKTKIKIPPPVKLAEAKPPPPKDAPPPPNEPPPETPSKPVPIVVGISMNSTTAVGGFAVQVGNTTYGKADKVVDPNTVKPYSAPKYAPPGGVDVDAVVAPGGEVKIDYPPEAKKNDVEGTVRLKLTIDDLGNVVNAGIINGPGYGLNEAARDAVKRFKFKPALKDGKPIGSTLVYAYTFLLD